MSIRGSINHYFVLMVMAIKQLAIKCAIELNNGAITINTPINMEGGMERVGVGAHRCASAIIILLFPQLHNSNTASSSRCRFFSTTNENHRCCLTPHRRESTVGVWWRVAVHPRSQFGCFYSSTSHKHKQQSLSFLFHSQRQPSLLPDSASPREHRGGLGRVAVHPRS